MSVSFDFTDRVALVTGASGALGSAVATVFRDAGATVAAADIVEPDDDDALLDPGGGIHFYQADLTSEDEVSDLVDSVVEDHGRLDFLLNIAGTWRGGSPIDETDVDAFDFLFDVNLKTMFLASKHALSHLRETEGAIVSVSARASLEGGEGDGPYRASKAGVRLLTETIAEENLGTVRANAVMPSVIDTPQNREMMPDADHDAWVDPAEIGRVMSFLCSDAAAVTSGAAVPVYGEA
ncbi:SDR family oxidoreductase [Halegenticoccus tardaugens]|uniref:SDR family oxidoreductase n=1 Tax=Halegenticoccus tardaugens TaxID=2071624 RepID=UPI00100B73F2|nr:SDR family oxidoreductase [Halegenticoccus tardaugens]